MIPLGLSLPVDYLRGACGGGEAGLYLAAFGPAREGLQRLRRTGVSTIELHRLSPLTGAEAVEQAAAAVLRAGLRVSVHGYLTEPHAGTGLLQACPWLPSVREMARGGQECLRITVHALAGSSGPVDGFRRRTVELLGLWARQASDAALPLRFALELNRAKGAVDPSTTWEGVESMCRQVGREEVGICWDWGHGYVNALRGLIPGEPPAGFLELVRNVHVHDVGPSGSTHWPLRGGGVPVERFVQLLRKGGYPGTLVLELDPPRFQAEGPVGPRIEGSLERLRGLLDP